MSAIDVLGIKDKGEIYAEYPSNTVTGNGFVVDRHLHSADHLLNRTVSSHKLQINIGSGILMSWRSNNVWNSQTCHSGDIAELISPGEAEDLKWSEDFHSLEITFDPLLIDRLVEKDKVTFEAQHAVHDPFVKDVAVKLFQATSDSFIENLYIESLIVVGAIHLAATYSTIHKKFFAPKGKLSARQVKNVIDYVKCNVNRSITLEELAGCTHLSIFHFSRLFKSTVGMSPYQFVLQVKIEYAKKLIKRKNSIGDIAYSLGFTDSAHFCNAFKKFNGYSPLQFNLL